MADREQPEQTRCGYVAIVGRPNVGKSTLLNRLVETRLAAVAPKPQTTRHNVTGILSGEGTQIVFVDTPGLHLGGKRLLNRMINEAAQSALYQVDLVVLLVDRDRWDEEDEYALAQVQASGRPCILCINKVDRMDKEALLPLLARFQGLHEFVALIPVSARTGTNLERLKAEIRRHLPVGPFVYPEDQVSSRSLRFLASERIREALVLATREEVPYAVYVEIERYEETPRQVEIDALVWVERPSQRAIVIGRKGQTMKRVGIAARQALEELTGKKVVLKLWVKDKAGWQDNPSVLASFDSATL